MRHDSAPLVVKFGGELLEDPARLQLVVGTVAAHAGGDLHPPTVVVHGGGKEIDAALKVAGLEKRQVDGLRITDEPTLDVVVAVLAGTVNTRFVAALTSARVAAVGLTGADAACGLADVAPRHRAVDGRTVDLGCVGIPSPEAETRLFDVLLRGGFVPVLSSIGLTRDGRLLNVNADTCAGHVAASLRASRLVIAGTTAGVLDGQGQTIPTLSGEALVRIIGDGTATAGMVAKLRACDHALQSGVSDVVIVDGRSAEALGAAMAGAVPAGATRIVAMV